MPIKKISMGQVLEDNVDMDRVSGLRSRGSSSGSMGSNKMHVMMLIVILGYLGTSLFESYDNYSKHKESNQDKLKKCLFEFDKFECNLSNMTPQCKELLRCIQHDEVSMETILEIVKT